MTDSITNTNPLLARIRIPGATYRLPSGGIFYHNGELAPTVTNGEIHVFPMTAIDEIVIRSPDRILDGLGIKEVFQRCIPDVLKPEQLFAKDIDYLMIALRQVSYGNTIDITYKHDCVNGKNNTYTINVEPFLAATKAIDPTTINQLYTVTLPNHQIVKLTPMRFQDIINVMQSSKYDNDTNGYEFRIFDSLVTVIDAVDEITDKSMISEWVRTIPREYFKSIADAIDKNSDWGPKTTSSLACKDCNHHIQLELPLNPIVFFI